MKKLFALLASLTLLLGLAFPAQAQLDVGITNDENFSKAFKNTFDVTAGQKLEQTLPAQIGRIVQLFVSFAGVIMLVIVVYAGILWMTAGGNTENVEKAKKLLRNAIIGLIIVLLAYIIVAFINTLIVSSGFGEAGKKT